MVQAPPLDDFDTCFDMTNQTSVSTYIKNYQMFNKKDYTNYEVHVHKIDTINKAEGLNSL